MTQHVRLEKSHSCSFCGNPQGKVNMLVAGLMAQGNPVFICDTCTKLCMAIYRREHGSWLVRFACKLSDLWTAGVETADWPFRNWRLRLWWKFKGRSFFHGIIGI